MTAPVNDPLGHVKGAYRVYFDRFADSNFTRTGRLRFAIIPNIGFNGSVETEDFYDPDDGVPEKVDSYQTAVNRVGSFVTESIDAHSIAAFNMGSWSKYSQSNTPVADEVIVVKKGYSYQLGIAVNHGMGVRNVSSVVVTDTAGTTTYVLNTDYTLNAVSGTIKILESGAITDAQSLKVDYTPATETRTITISGEDIWEGELFLESNNAVGKKQYVLFTRVKLTPNGDFQLRPDSGPQQIPFSFEILKRTGIPAVVTDYLDA